MAQAADLPLAVQKYGESPVFTETTVPEKLTSRHNTKPGVWDPIVVLSGCLNYVVTANSNGPLVLTPDTHGIIAPEQYHHVEVIGPVEFYRSNEDKT